MGGNRDRSLKKLTRANGIALAVLARGEVRPDIGTLYYPVPITNGVSLLPEARWGLLPHGGASVGWNHYQ